MRKKENTDRDYSAVSNIDGREFWLSGWVKTSNAGKTFLSLATKAKDAAQAKPQAKLTRKELDDDIPF